MSIPTAAEAAKQSVGQLREVLRVLRTTPLRRSDVAVVAGEKVLRSSSRDNEYWAIVEQVVLAALDLGDFPKAQKYYKELEAQFGKAKRVQRLLGTMLEASGRYSEAEAVYSNVLKDSPTDKATIWRKAACSKAQGKYEEAVREIEGHLQIVHDEEAYAELLSIHLNKPQPDYDKAGTACEELLLHDPTVWAYHLLYAETLLSGGGNVGAYTSARAYLSQAAQQTLPNNTRALWGLWNTCRALRESKFSLSQKETADNEALFAWVAERLTSIYEKLDTPQAKTSLLVLQQK